MTPGEATNPYVGPRAFESADSRSFFGRGREARELSNLVIARRAVLLYAPSGAGKSSLLRAGLVPLLEQRGRLVILPPARPGELEPSTIQERLSEEARRQPHLLIVDPLEEVFTLHPDRAEEPAAFFRQLRDALAGWPQLRLLLSLREDFLAQLDPFLGMLPDRLRCRLRLDFLGPAAAGEAVAGPARQAGVPFAEPAMHRLVDDLRRQRAQAADGSMVERLGPCVDPVQLQVVCRGLWERLPAGTVEIGCEHLGSVGSVDSALAGYYAGQVAAAARESGIPERAVRDWIDVRLITIRGVRTQVLRTGDAEQGLDDRAVRRLVGGHLVRAEERRGAVWYELAHDRLVGPVRADNAAWREANLSPVEWRAALWDAQKRPANLLLRGRELRNGERWAAGRTGRTDRDTSLAPVERAFLAACRRRRRQARLFGLGGALLLLAVLALAVQHREAEEQRGRALLQGLAAQARLALHDRLDLALLLGVEADRRGGSALGRQLLFETLSASPGLTALLHGAADVLALALSPDGRRLATAGEDGKLRLWDLGERRPLDPPLAGHHGAVWSIAWSPDGHRLASAGADGAVLLWDLNASPPRPERLGAGLETDGEVYAVAFSPDGRALAAAASDRRVHLWSTATRRPIGNPLAGATDQVSCLAWSPDGSLLAIGGMDKAVRIYRTATGDLWGPPLAGHAEGITGLSWSPGGDLLASSSLDGGVILWEWTAGGGRRYGWPLSQRTGPLTGVAFSPDGRRLAAGSQDGTLSVWDMERKQPALPPLTGLRGNLRGLAWSADGHTLAAGHGATVGLWDVEATTRLGRRFHLEGRTITALAAGPAGTVAVVVAMGDAGGSGLALFDPRTGRMKPILRAAGAERLTGLVLPGGGRSLAAGLGGTLLRQDRGALRAVPLAGAEGRFTALAIAPDGRALATGDERGEVRLWDTATGSLRVSVKIAGRISSLAWSPDGSALACGDSGGRLTLLESGGRLRAGPWPAHRGRVSRLAFQPGGRKLASAGDDGMVRLWRAADGRPAGNPLAGHDQPVVALAFSPDGERLASADRRYRILLWDVDSGELFAGPFTGHEEEIAGLLFTGNGLLSADRSGLFLLWDVDPVSWRERARRLAGRSLTPAERERFLPQEEKPGT